MNNKDRIKIAGYIRVSTADQIDGESLTTQEDAIKQFAKLKDWELTKVYSDKGKSGENSRCKCDIILKVI
jgi:DNA invertase Pin-like site-specific DNA recombinase